MDTLNPVLRLSQQKEAFEKLVFKILYKYKTQYFNMLDNVKFFLGLWA